MVGSVLGQSRLLQVEVLSFSRPRLYFQGFAERRGSFPSVLCYRVFGFCVGLPARKGRLVKSRPILSFYCADGGDFWRTRLCGCDSVTLKCLCSEQSHVHASD